MTTFGKIYLDPSENATRYNLFGKCDASCGNEYPIPTPRSQLTPFMTPEESMHGLVTSETSQGPGLPCQFAKKGKVPMLTPTAVPRSLDYVALGATVPSRVSAVAAGRNNPV